MSDARFWMQQSTKFLAAVAFFLAAIAAYRAVSGRSFDPLSVSPVALVILVIGLAVGTRCDHRKFMDGKSFHG